MSDKYVQLNIRVTKSKHYNFKLACLKLGTNMSAVLRDAVSETIVRASLMKGATNGTD